MIYISFNEASLIDDDSYIINLENYYNMIKNINKHKVVGNYYYTDKIYIIPFKNGSTLNDFLYDKRIDYDLRLGIKMHLDKSQKIDSNKFEGYIEYSNPKYNEYMDGFNISISKLEYFKILNVLSCDEWKKSTFKVDYVNLDGVKTNYEIENFSLINDYSKLIDENNLIIMSNISSGIDLWNKREELFPNLFFCGITKEQIYDLYDKSEIEAIIKKLFILQDYFKSADYYDGRKISARDESDSVKNDDKLKQQRLFELPNGEKKYFYEHISLNTISGAKRIHFLPCCSNKIAYIGYIGKHLKTANF